MTDRFVIVGGGLAAATAAEELRERGVRGEIALFAAEPHVPYQRPPLSKGYLLGAEGADSAFVHPATWYDEHDIALTTGTRVQALGDHRLTLDDGREMPFDRLLIATGAKPRALDVAGAGDPRIRYLRTLDDSERLKADLAPGGRHVVVIGAGWIGLETAAAARTYGNDVTVVMRGEVPLASAVGAEIGSMFRELHEQHGVVFRSGAQITALGPDGVHTDGGVIAADVMVAGIGAAPDTALAEAAGLAVDNGILTDAHLATSAPDIFAAGDVANPMHPVIGQRMRNEHWANAIAGGKVAAASMAGVDAVLDEIPYFYTDQFDLGMEYSGYPPLARDARVVYRGDRAAREFVAFWLSPTGAVVAGMNVNVWDVNDQVQRLIREARPVDEARLTDPAVDLSAL
ncbi:MAG TPA: FAD-dependent oxidoreductase [Pseudolysinimonas sp.]|jgi:3-phenylpropionate/trans-cinnamate dioxygenase ferredoxin reductase subunit|nr:FAD-dependent oxidoreductase [Pseudolysinimonas sp.]